MPWTSDRDLRPICRHRQCAGLAVFWTIQEKKKKKTCQCFYCVLLVKNLQTGEMPLSCIAVCGLSDKVRIMKTNSSENMVGERHVTDRAGEGAVERAGSPNS